MTTYYDIMFDTMNLCNTDPFLKSSIQYSIAHQVVVAEEQTIDEVTFHNDLNKGKVLVTGDRSFEAARKYAGKHIAVLNFANNRNAGGNPYYANAQEECLCRCSTLLPCLNALYDDFYKKHNLMIRNGELDYMGNDDLIYTPDVVVFKSDEDKPQLLGEDEWFKVNVITCAAPELWEQNSLPRNYYEVVYNRLKKVLDIAVAYKNEVVILGAWGCGAFANPPRIVANIFNDLIKQYVFPIIHFAIGSSNSTNYSIFHEMLSK